METVGV